MFHEWPTATTDMPVLLSELLALPSGFLLVEHTARRGRSPLRDGVEPEAWRPWVFLRQAQDKLTLRRTIQVRLGSNPADRGTVPRWPARLA
jgi:hypothetical protein